MPIRDPRPDLMEDHKLWEKMLNFTWYIDHGEAGGLYAALHGIRCLGARLEFAERRLRLVKGKRYTGTDWEMDRQRWLMPHKKVLQELLRSMSWKEVEVS